MTQLPTEIPAPRTDSDDAGVRIALSIEWTRRPAYAVVAQSALNRLKTARIHWIDLHTGRLTWQIRDRVGLLSMIEMLRRVHRTAVAVFLDGEHYATDPTGDDYHAA